MKPALLIIAAVIVAVGIGMMAFGYKKNRTDGSKRYHPGDPIICLRKLSSF